MEDRNQCLIKVQEILRSNQTTPVDFSYFWPANSTLLTIDPKNPDLTVAGCNALCGVPTPWYDDIGQRYFTWLLPIFLLLANVHVSPLDKQRYLEPLLFLGDPITSFWSLLKKVDAWVQCEDQAKKNKLVSLNEKDLGTLLIGIEEIAGLEANPMNELRMLFQQHSRNQSCCSSDSCSKTLLQQQLMKQAAFKLARGRTDDILRTGFAVSLYILQLAAGFNYVLGGGNNSPPGGRIATAMMLTWLIPAVLWSNTVGGFATRDTCFEIMKELWQECKKLTCESRNDPEIKSSGAENEDQPADLEEDKIVVDDEVDTVEASLLQNKLEQPEKFYRAQRWSGATYIYRQERPYRQEKPSWARSILIAILSVLPVTIGFGFGSAILWYTPPNGLDCRGIMLILIAFAWYISAALTWIIWKAKSLSAKAQWRLVVYKDATIAIPCILMIFLSSAGLFNTCYCWSASFSWRGEAHVPVNANVKFEFYDNKLYPILAGICVGLQFMVFVLMVSLGWPGLRLMGWSEKEKRRRWTE